MAMPASATFKYRVQVLPSDQAGARVWTGGATTLFPVDHHPGLVGSAPDFELSNGVVSLRPTQLGRILSLVTGGAPARAVTFRIGSVLDELLEPGDVILLDRDAMAARSVCVLRGRHLLLALGALTCRAALPGDDDLRIDEDPRTEQRDDYWFARLVRERQAHIVWIDPQVEPIEVSVRGVEHLADGRPLVIAYRNVDQAAFTPYFDHQSIRRFGSISYAGDPRFDTLDEWRAYLMGLPAHPPTDLQLHARWGREQVCLAKGQEAELGPFVVRAEQVNWAIEWQRSSAAVIRQTPAADRAAFREASALLISDPLHISDA